MAINLKITIFIVQSFFLFSLTSCSSNNTGNLNTMLEMYKSQNNKKEILNINSNMIQNINFPLLEVRSSHIIKQILMLQISERYGFTNYYSGSGQGLTMYGAYVTKTNGFDFNLISLEIKEKNELLKRNEIYSKFDRYFTKTYKFINPLFKSDNHNFKCINSKQDFEIIQILEKNLNLLKVEEKCFNNKWKFTNIYWLDKSEKVLKSKQYLFPKGEYIEITTLKL